MQHFQYLIKKTRARKRDIKSKKKEGFRVKRGIHLKYRRYITLINIHR